MAKTNIEWTQHNYNPFYGCRRKSDGCKNCYAEQIAGRFSGTDKNGVILPYSGIAEKKNGESRWTGEVKLNEEVLLAPLKRKAPTTYFVNSMSDTFYSKFPDEWIDKLFAVIALCPQHTFQILTKRAERMRNYIPTLFKYEGYLDDFWLGDAIENLFGKSIPQMRTARLCKTLPNVHLGVSVENQKAADERIPFLLETPAVVRWLSCEPLLEKVNLTKLNFLSRPLGHQEWFDALHGASYLRNGLNDKHSGFFNKTNKIDWVIAGGESGQNARPCNIDWIRSIVRQCQNTGVPVFVKQLGSKAHTELFGGLHWIKTNNKKGGDISEFPEDLQIRQFPK